MSANIIDDIESKSLETVDIVDQEPNIISFDDLTNKIEYQFSPIAQLGIDQYDYFKWFMINIIKVPEIEFPNNALLYINEDNIEDYQNFIECIKYNIRKMLGITFNEEDHFFDNLYNIYYFFIVRPQDLLRDILLDYHFYKDGYNFENFYKTRILTNNIPTIDISSMDPVAIYNGVRTEYFERNKKDMHKMSYGEKFNSFMVYFRSIILNKDEFKFYDMFQKAFEFSGVENYEYLQDQIDILYNIRYEDMDLITDYITKKICNIEYRETWLTTELIDPFFKKIKDFEMHLATSAL